MRQENRQEQPCACRKLGCCRRKNRHGFPKDIQVLLPFLPWLRDYRNRGVFPAFFKGSLHCDCRKPCRVRRPADDRLLVVQMGTSVFAPRRGSWLCVSKDARRRMSGHYGSFCCPASNPRCNFQAFRFFSPRRKLVKTTKLAPSATLRLTVRLVRPCAFVCAIRTSDSISPMSGADVTVPSAVFFNATIKLPIRNVSCPSFTFSVSASFFIDSSVMSKNAISRKRKQNL